MRQTHVHVLDTPTENLTSVGSSTLIAPPNPSTDHFNPDDRQSEVLKKYFFDFTFETVGDPKLLEHHHHLQKQ